MNKDSKVVAHGQLLNAAAHLLRLEGDYPAAQAAERAARELSAVPAFVMPDVHVEPTMMVASAL